VVWGRVGISDAMMLGVGLMGKRESLGSSSKDFLVFFGGLER
jgi:hypothetical protein